MARWMRLMAAAVLAASGGGAGALESYGDYDSFDGSPPPSIDAAKWADFERRREVINDQLRLVIRDGGFTNSDSGRRGISWGNDLTRPGKVTQLKARVQVDKVESTGCAFNPSPSRARVRLIGTFFNTGNRAVGSYYGDVIAQIFLARDSNTGDAPGEMRVTGVASVCTNSDCSTATDIGSVSFAKINVGQGAVLVMEWDRTGKQFRFSRDGGTTFQSVPYTVNDSALPGIPFVSVSNRLDIANCQSGPRAFAQIESRIDNVFVNTKGQP